MGINYIHYKLLQGFVVDGFPKTYSQAKQLFDLEDLEDLDQEGATGITYNQLIMPGKELKTGNLDLSTIYNL